MTKPALLDALRAALAQADALAHCLDSIRFKDNREAEMAVLERDVDSIRHRLKVILNGEEALALAIAMAPST